MLVAKIYPGFLICTSIPKLENLPNQQFNHVDLKTKLINMVLNLITKD
jgi:hypothetical protein